MIRVLLVFLLGSSLLTAQEYAQFHGTWINATIIDVLHTTRSIERALAARPPHHPIYVRFDSADIVGHVKMCFTLGTEEESLVRKSHIEHVGMKWGIGDDKGPQWVLNRDEKNGSYVALTPVDSLENKPVVLGRLPSTNQDPIFILIRMVNSSILKGRWKDASGKIYEFTSGQQLVINDKPTAYKLDISPSGSSVKLVVPNTGRPHQWSVVRDGPTLTLTSLQKPKGTIIPQKVLHLQLVGK